MQVNDHGEYRVANLPPGQYRVSIANQNKASRVMRSGVSEGTADAAQATPIVLKAGTKCAAWIFV